MRRPGAIGVAFLVAVAAAALAVPTAQAARVDPHHTRYRYFQDLSVTGSFPGQIFFTVLYRENRNGEFTPRDVMSYRLQVGVSCNPGGQSGLEFSGNAFNKYGYFREVLSADGRFAHRFEDQAETPQSSLIRGDLEGQVLKRLKRGGRVKRTARVNGTFNVENWDPYGLTGVVENCMSFGSYSATPCKAWMSPRAPNYSRWKRWKVPVCRETW